MLGWYLGLELLHLLEAVSSIKKSEHFFPITLISYKVARILLNNQKVRIPFEWVLARSICSSLLLDKQRNCVQKAHDKVFRSFQRVQ